MSEEIWRRVPNWLIGIGLISAAAVVGIQMYRGDALVCADGSVFATKCGPDENVEQFPPGAVIAFHRSERDGGARPENWELYRDAGGRMIIGAGQHENTDVNGNLLQTYPSFADSNFSAAGGAETHTLTVAEMPDHSHKLTASKVEGNRGFSDNGDFPGLGLRERGVDPSNEETQDVLRPRALGQPHNNMPPYIALYFCKKEG